MIARTHLPTWKHGGMRMIGCALHRRAILLRAYGLRLVPVVDQCISVAQVPIAGR